MKRKINEPNLIRDIYNKAVFQAATRMHLVRFLVPDTGTDDVEVIPATEEQRAEELAQPDVAKGLGDTS